MKDGNIQLKPRPGNFSGLAKNLGDMAEAVCLQNEPAVVLEALGFHEDSKWPAPDTIAAHACAYRVLARMARERLIEETLTFNYDCHNEAACIAEGFLERDHPLSSQFWPSRYGVVATRASNTDLTRRDGFTVVKAHRMREVLARGKADVDACLFAVRPGRGDSDSAQPAPGLARRQLRGTRPQSPSGPVITC